MLDAVHFDSFFGMISPERDIVQILTIKAQINIRTHHRSRIESRQKLKILGLGLSMGITQDSSIYRKQTSD